MVVRPDNGILCSCKKLNNGAAVNVWIQKNLQIEERKKEKCKMVQNSMCPFVFKGGWGVKVYICVCLYKGIGRWAWWEGGRWKAGSSLVPFCLFMSLSHVLATTFPGENVNLKICEASVCFPSLPLLTRGQFSLSPPTLEQKQKLREAHMNPKFLSSGCTMSFSAPKV